MNLSGISSKLAVAVVALAAIGAGSMVAPTPVSAAAIAPQATAASTPHFQLGRVECVNGGQLRAYPPRVMRPVHNVDFRNAELVKWSPDLQILTSSGWVNFDTRRPFYQAFTAVSGFYHDQFAGAWRGRSGQLTWDPFTDLQPGTYRIRNWLYWDKLGRTYYADSGQTCRFF